MVKCTGRGLVVKRPGVLSKVQLLESCLGGGGLFPSSNMDSTFCAGWGFKDRVRTLVFEGLRENLEGKHGVP